MDKNTVIGLVIIFLILIGFSYLNRPSEEQVREMQRQDSIARVEKQKMEIAAVQRQLEMEAAANGNAAGIKRDSVFMQDSLAEQLYT